MSSTAATPIILVNFDLTHQVALYMRSTVKKRISSKEKGCQWYPTEWELDFLADVNLAVGRIEDAILNSCKLVLQCLGNEAEVCPKDKTTWRARDLEMALSGSNPINEADILKDFPPLDGPALEFSPLSVTDKEGNIVCFYLPDLLSEKRSVRIFPLNETEGRLIQNRKQCSKASIDSRASCRPKTYV